MVNIYELDFDMNRYQVLVYLCDADSRIEELFNGNPIGAKWPGLTVRVFREDEKNRTAPVSDSPSLASNIPVFSKRAVAALKELLAGNGELFPIECDEGDYYVYNVTTVADVLNEAASEIKRFMHSGKIMRIVRPVFYGEKLNDLIIFKIPQNPLATVYVTDKFVDRVKQAGLTGFLFNPLG